MLDLAAIETTVDRESHMHLTHPPFSTIIRALPVEHHAVTVQAALWGPHFIAARQHRLFNAVFGNQPQVQISRGRLLHEQLDPIQKCAEILLWGFPRGMRGQQHLQFLQNAAVISHQAGEHHPWPVYYGNLHEIGGLGIAMITKLAYFFSIPFGGLPALILDSRLIRRCSDHTWEELAELNILTYNNCPGRYLDYIGALHGVAEQLQCHGDQVEFFLFELGDSFDDAA
jgi:8-oxoguanine DNA glycosylase-like protein